MVDKVRATDSAQAPATETTSNHTVADFGTVTGAIIIAQLAGAVDADAADAAFSVGVWDGTDEACAHRNTPDAVSYTNYATGRSDNVNAVYIREGTVADAKVRKATCTGIANGIQLSWDAGSPRPYVTVLLIQANSAKSGGLQMSTTDGGTAQASSLGLTPNFVFMAGAGSGTPNWDQSITPFSLGFATKDSVIKQKGIAYDVNESASASIPSCSVHTDRITAYMKTALRTTYEVTSMSSGEFTVTTRNVILDDDPYRVYLAVNFDDVPELFDFSTPTAAGAWEPYTDTQERQSVLMIPTFNTSVDAAQSYSSSYGTGFGWYFVSTEGDQQGGFITVEYGVTTQNASGQRANKLIIQDDTGGTPVVTAVDPTFDPTGLVFASGDITYDASARKGIGIAFGAASGTTLVVADAAQSMTADNAALTQSNTLAVAEALHAIAADNVTLTQKHTLAIAEALLSVTTDPVALTQKNTIAVADALQSMTADNLELVGASTLVMAEALLSVTADPVALTQKNTLVVAEALQTIVTDGIALNQKHTLLVDDATLALQSDNVILSTALLLSVADALLSITADTPALIQKHTLEIAEAVMAMTADPITLLPGHVLLAVQDALLNVSADNLALTQKSLLVVADTLQSLTVEEPLVSPEFTLELADALQSIGVDSVALTQKHILATNDALLALTAENAVLTPRLIVNDALMAMVADAVVLGRRPVKPDAIFVVNPDDAAHKSVFVVVTADRIELIQAERKLH